VSASSSSCPVAFVAGSRDFGPGIVTQRMLNLRLRDYPFEPLMLIRLESAIAVLTCGCMVAVAASPSSIGIVVTSGQAQVDGAIVRGNSTLFQGSDIQAGNVASDVMLPGGSNLLLQPGSAVRVYREYAVLRNGAAIERGSHGYALIADGLKVSSLSPQGAIFVGMQDASHVKVSTEGGGAEVRNPAGDLVARLEAGKVLSFTIQAAPQSQAAPPNPGQAAPAVGTQLTLHGILHKDHPGRYGHFLLTDLVSKTTYELQGSGLDDLVGASVEVTGSTFDATPAPGASLVVSVSDIHQMPLSEMPGGPLGPAPAPTPATPEPPPTPAEAPPTPSGDTAPTSTGGAEVGATPEATPPPEVSNAPAVPPLVQHSDTTKILVIVALAAGAVVGVALGLGGGKSSTVSPE
jgi:hypothetical protein